MPVEYETYRKLPGLVLGFHGCDKATGESILDGSVTHLDASQNLHDWLGSGIYFWENDPKRAREFAEEAVTNPKLTSRRIKDPFVIGAVIDLGRCLNLLDRIAVGEVEESYKLLKSANRAKGLKLQKNKGPDRAARYLDRAVLEFLHATREELNNNNPGKYPPYETVRGAFWEGGKLYPTSGFGRKNHIQIAVRDPNCIKGYFRPILG